MAMQIGKKIKELRRRKQVSQEKLAERLNVSFQAVSKWENEVTLPDVTLVPVIAEYFGVSTDELLGVNRMETERRITEICEASWECRGEDPARAERILRDGLQRYPGNEVLLNNLLYTMRAPDRRDEVIEICRMLADNAVEGDVKYDALRILAETYASMGEEGLARSAVERIPEIYFTKLEVAAETLSGPEALDAARRQRNLSADLLARMLLRVSQLAREAGDEAEAEENDRMFRGLMDAVGGLRYAFEEGTLAGTYADERRG